MKLILESPTKLRFPPGVEAKLREPLKYHDLRVEFEYRKHKNSSYFIQVHGEEAWKTKLEELEAKRYSSLLFEDDQGFWTYSGLHQLVSRSLGGCELERRYELPETKTTPWSKLGPPKQPRDYQTRARDALLAAVGDGPAAVEMGTGLGKGFIIAMLLREIGLPAVVMAPSVSIFNQLRDDLTACFGKKFVGALGDGKKDLGKQFVVAIAASLTRVKPGSAEWTELNLRKVFIADESHLCPANTLAAVCFGLMAPAPYRFFFSGTQLRQDGLDKLLQGITGPVVYDMPVSEGVDQGWLARPAFTAFKVGSPSRKRQKDPNEQTRDHLYYNSVVNSTAGALANRFVGQLRKPTLILVEEVEQFAYLLPYLSHKAGFAHGGLNKDNRGKVPEAYWKSDPTALVKAFNAGELPILVGTSCIGTGTDIRAAEAIIYLQGGKSEIQVRQAVGRGTRGGRQVDVMNPWTGKRKENCHVVDFDVSAPTYWNRDTHQTLNQREYDALEEYEQADYTRSDLVTHKHAQERIAIYEDVCAQPVKEIQL